MTKSERKIRNDNITDSILRGATFEEVAFEYGLSKPAIHKIFRLTCVHFFFSDEMEDIKKKGNNITAMRKKWREVAAARFV